MYSYRIWDKTSPINDCPANEALQSLGVKDTEQLCILSQNGHDCITQTFQASTTADEIKAWVDAFNEQQIAAEKAVEEAAKQPTLEQRVAAQEQAIAELSILVAGGNA